MAPFHGRLRLLRRFPGLSLLAALLLACGTSGALVQLSDLRQHPAFDARALAVQGLAILGFEGRPADVAESERDRRLDYPLYAAARSAQPDAVLVGAKTVRGRLQAAGIAERVEQLLRAELIGELPFASLREALPSTRFLLSAHLLSNEVIESSASADEEVAYCATRSVAVRYRVLDLAARRSAWHAVIRRQEQDCNHNEHQNRAKATKPGRGRLLGAMFSDLLSNALTDAIQGTYPAAPALTPITDAAARDLASVLFAGSNTAARTGR